MPRWMQPQERFWSKVEKTKGCWEWIGCCSDTGYGNFYADGALHLTHRYSWALAHGNIPSGLCVLHRCDNRKCVRPDHLFLGSKKANSEDMARKGRHRVPSLKGSAHGESKLTEQEVLRIRELAAAGQLLKHIAAKYNVSPSLIGLIVRRKAWKHV